MTCNDLYPYFYLHWPFTAWKIMGLHDIQSFVLLSNILPFTIDTIPFFILNLIYRILTARFKVFRFDPLTFNISCEYQILYAFVPHYLSQKCQLSHPRSSICYSNFTFKFLVTYMSRLSVQSDVVLFFFFTSEEII